MHVFLTHRSTCRAGRNVANSSFFSRSLSLSLSPSLPLSPPLLLSAPVHKDFCLRHIPFCDPESRPAAVVAAGIAGAGAGAASYAVRSPMDTMYKITLGTRNIP